ncbi:MAG TPA: adenylate/guanylate cyclase domain-containing protein [Usitatibacter sp.]|nr:adenylate/guanylate cyclase domain-containing protein [Usitatibacter sp.]
MLDQANRTFICSVVFIDLVGYSKKPVTEQIRLKTSLTSNLSEAIKDIPVNDRIILDTGDGAAISFLGDPEDALFVTLSLRERMIAEGMTATIVEASGDDSVRMGINLGPVKLVKDINGHPNIIGDGINVAQRIMSFARPGQIVVSRSYYDVVSNLASEYAKLFHYEGSRTDKHVREHEIYVVGHHEGALQKAKDGMKDRASSTTPNQRKASAAPGTSTVTLSIPAFVQDKKKLTMVAGGLAALVLFLAILVFTKKPANAPVEVAAAPPTTTAAPVTEPPKAVPPAAEPAKATEAAKPADSTGAAPSLETKVLSPTPSSAVIPPAAPPSETSKDAAREAKREGEKALKDKQGAEEKKPALPPATLVFAIQPWGEIYVNGKSRGVTPPMKSIKLEPGKYKIEVRNTTFPPHTENFDLKARDEITVRHKFQ